MEIALAISIISVVITVVNFALNRKDKAIKDTKEDNKVLIEYRLDQVEKKLDKILEKLDYYDEEIDNKIDKAIKQHISIYHKLPKKKEA